MKYLRGWYIKNKNYNQMGGENSKCCSKSPKNGMSDRKGKKELRQSKRQDWKDNGKILIENVD